MSAIALPSVRLMEKPTRQLNVAAMGVPEKVAESIRRAVPRLPQEVQDFALALISPASLEMIAGTLVFWAASHLIGIGEIADLILLVAGVVTLGKTALEAGKELIAFGQIAVSARRPEELDAAAQHFARAVMLAGIATVSAILLRRSMGAGRAPAARTAAAAEETLYARTVQQVNMGVIKQLIIDLWRRPRNWPVKICRLRIGQKVGDAVKVSGYVTTEQSVMGATIRQLEQRLGLAPGALGDKVAVVRLGRLPDPAEFDLRFYNNVNGGGVRPPNPNYPLGPGFPQWELLQEVAGCIQRIISG